MTYCRCYAGNVFPEDPLYDVATPDDDEVFWCGRCHDAMHPSTIGRLQQFERILERLDCDGKLDHEGRAVNGPLTVVLTAKRVGKGHPDEGRVYDYDRRYYWRGQPARLTRWR